MLNRPAPSRDADMAREPARPLATPTLRPRLRWPGLCAICHGWGFGRVCATCLDRFAAERPRCRRCALPLTTSASGPDCGACLVDPPPFDAAIAAVDYRPPWDRLIADFKFHGAVELAAVFTGALAVSACRAETAPTLLLPVPLAPARLRERGYNQAWEIARRLGHALHLDARSDVLLRLRDTAHQLDLPPAARAGNVQGAFAIEPRRRASLGGRHVAVVDDVMTTGHTLAEIARALKQAGAAHVSVWVVARTPRPSATGPD